MIAFTASDSSQRPVPALLQVSKKSVARKLLSIQEPFPGIQETR